MSTKVKFDTTIVSAAIQKAYETNHPDPPEYQDDLFVILDYLPQLYQDESEEEYIKALVLAMQTSYDNGLFQFAYVQYHMLFMTAVYFVLLKISLLHKEEFDKALNYLIKDRYNDFYKPENTKNGQLYFGSFAAINENDVFLLFHIVGMDSDMWGQLKSFVKERNLYAHANGQLQLTSEEYFIEKIQAFNNKAERIFSLIHVDVLRLYFDRLSDSNFYDPDVRAYIDADQQIQEEFIRTYSLSRIELNWCRKSDIRKMGLAGGFANIRELHIALCKYYKRIDTEQE